MELKLPTLEQLRAAYDRDLRGAFPEAELKPLENMEQMWRQGRYKPYCLFDGQALLGEAFLWLGHPGWALLDYLCVTAGARNGGLGAALLRALSQAEGDTVIFGESEAPQDAPDPAMARRRLEFYARCGLRTAGYDTELFGIHYRTLYLSRRAVEDAVLLTEHRFVYESVFAPEKFARYVRIPFDPAAGRGERTAWQQ